jgi:hypothetical protein
MSTTILHITGMGWTMSRLRSLAFGDLVGGNAGVDNLAPRAPEMFR